MLKSFSLLVWAIVGVYFACAGARANTTLNENVEGSWYSTSASELHAYLVLDDRGCGTLAVQQFVGEPPVLYKLRGAHLVDGVLQTRAARMPEGKATIEGALKQPFIEIRLLDPAERDGAARILLEHSETIRERQRVLDVLRSAVDGSEGDSGKFREIQDTH